MFKLRLQRLPLLFTDCPVYFLTACTRDRRAILATRETHHTFESFSRNAGDWNVLVGSYVIMPDHVHLFAAFTPESPLLSTWMRALKRTLAKDLSARGVRGPHWQKGYFDHVMRSEESYEQKWLYVRDNPVRAGLVRNCEEWSYQGEIHPLTVGKL